MGAGVYQEWRPQEERLSRAVVRCHLIFVEFEFDTVRNNLSTCKLASDGDVVDIQCKFKIVQAELSMRLQQNQLQARMESPLIPL